MGELGLKELIADPRRSANSTVPRTGAEKSYFKVPQRDVDDHKGQNEFKAKHTTPIPKQDANLFSNLVRQIFTYDQCQHITAKQILKHPWLMKQEECEGDGPDGKDAVLSQ
jgi:hypothetical protein